MNVLDYFLKQIIKKCTRAKNTEQNLKLTTYKNHKRSETRGLNPGFNL